MNFCKLRRMLKQISWNISNGEEGLNQFLVKKFDHVKSAEFQRFSKAQTPMLTD